MEPETALKLEVAALTDVGCKRTNNEDSFGYDLATGLFVVCDGMGGNLAGETASATAVKEMVEEFSRLTATGAPGEECLFSSILHANRQVYALSQSNDELRGMGTTLVSAFVQGRRMVVGNVGDSRAYFLRGGACAQITNDHSFVAEQVRSGSMNLEEAGASPLQSLITRAIGAAETVEPDIFTGILEHGDILLLTTDGLTRYADANAIAALVLASASLTGACQALIDTAKRQGAVDNVTCLMVQFLEAPVEQASPNDVPSIEEPPVPEMQITHESEPAAEEAAITAELPVSEGPPVLEGLPSALEALLASEEMPAQKASSALEEMLAAEKQSAPEEEPPAA